MANLSCLIYGGFEVGGPLETRSNGLFSVLGLVINNSLKDYMTLCHVAFISTRIRFVVID